MIAKIRQFLSPPKFEDREKNRQANLLYVILILFELLIVARSVLGIYVSGGLTALSVGLPLIIMAIYFGEYILMRQGQVQLASILFAFTYWVATAVSVPVSAGVSGPFYSLFIVVVVAVGLLLGGRWAFAFALSSIIAGGVFVWLGSQGQLIVDSLQLTPVAMYISISQSIVSVAIFVFLYHRVTTQMLTDLSNSERELESRNRELQVVQSSLEQQVSNRTKNLETSAEISAQIINILNIDELLNFMVNRLQSGYGYYHTQIYLIDEETGDLIMREGSGSVGKQLKERGHRLSAGEGIVGTVAATNESFFSNNVADLISFVPNPLLPDTKSELAVPLRKGDVVLGVLDMQSDQQNFFDEKDIDIMQSIANQAAVAIDNSRLLRRTQAALRQVEVLNSRLTRETWQEFGDTITTSGYRYQSGTRSQIIPDSSAWISPMKQAAIGKEVVKQVQSANGDPADAELAVPLMLRGEVIGVLGVKRKERPNWSDEEVSAVESVANQIARALENARLSQEQERTIYQLKEVDRLKSDFLTSMSHELRTPLNSIIGFADILLQGIDGPLSEHATTDISAIHNSGKHLLALINDILDLSKIEAGRMELARQRLSIPSLFEDVANSVSSLLKDKPVELIQKLDPAIPEVWVDPLRISQVVINLVSNAVKFTDEGSVTIAAEMYLENEVHIYVRDTGIGIPDDKIDIIFDRFRQVDSKNNRKYQGTGMGLAIARQLVELHGGQMWVESTANEGSTFHFTLPLIIN